MIKVYFLLPSRISSIVFDWIDFHMVIQGSSLLLSYGCAAFWFFQVLATPPVGKKERKVLGSQPWTWCMSLLLLTTGWNSAMCPSVSVREAEKHTLSVLAEGKEMGFH
jgi:hypothetical protein